MRIIIGCVLAAGTAWTAQSSTPPPTAEARIATIERDALSFPRAALKPGDQPPARTCTIVPPAKIVFPTTKGDPSAYNLTSGEFFAGSISFGWGPTMEIAKMPLTPQHPEDVGRGLRVITMRIDTPGQTLTDTVQLNSGSGRPFFPTWLHFPSDGTWLVLLTAGVNWGCFVVDRPVKR